MTKNGQYEFFTKEEMNKIWSKGWRWGFAVGIITMLLASIGIILGLVDSLQY